MIRYPAPPDFKEHFGRGLRNDAPKFVVGFHGRAGSSAIRGLINQHPQINFGDEELGHFIERADGSALQAGFLKAFFDSGPSEIASGFKFKFAEVPDLDAVIEELNRRQCIFIYLNRADLPRQAISVLRAAEFARRSEERGLPHGWNVSVDSISQGLDRVPPMHIDGAQYIQALSHLYAMRALANATLGRLTCPVVEIRYLDIHRNLRSVVDYIVSMLGRDRMDWSRVSDYYLKHTPEDVSTVVKNVEELMAYAALRGGEFDTDTRASLTSPHELG